MMARVTTSRGASSASGCTSAMNRSPDLIQQQSALATHRLGDERPRRARKIQRGRVELHERHVGDGRPRAIRQRDPVAAGGLGIGRLAIEHPRAARREHRGFRPTPSATRAWDDA